MDSAPAGDTDAPLVVAGVMTTKLMMLGVLRNESRPPLSSVNSPQVVLGGRL